jgi:hypothetical protein
MRALIISTNCARNTSLSKKNSVRHYYHKCTYIFRGSIRYSCQSLMKLESSRRIFEKYSNAKFHENPSSGGRIVLCGQTDRQADRTKLLVALRNLRARQSTRVNFRAKIRTLHLPNTQQKARPPHRNIQEVC